MKRILSLTILLILFALTATSQKNDSYYGNKQITKYSKSKEKEKEDTKSINEVKLRTSWIIFDLFQHENTFYFDYRSHLPSIDIAYQREINIKNNIGLNIGIGYSFMYYETIGIRIPQPNFLINRHHQYFSNLNMIAGIRYRTSNSNNVFDINLNGYYTLNRARTDYRFSEIFFATIDLLYQKIISEHLGLIVYTPIGIKPPFTPNYGLVGEPLFSPWIGISGLGVGITFMW